jgi:cysteine desulfuration protein SufE
MSDMETVQNRIITKMRPLNDWLEKYEYLIRLGNALPPMNPILRTQENAIGGCQANVWVWAQIVNGRMRFQGDSEAKITRGILALVLTVVEGQAPSDVSKADFFCIREIGLTAHLSPSRANGLVGIIKRVKALSSAMNRANGQLENHHE